MNAILKSTRIIVIILVFLHGASIARAVVFAKVGTFGSAWERFAVSPRMAALGGANVACATGVFGPLANAAPMRSKQGLAVGYAYQDYLADIAIKSRGASYQWQALRFSFVDVLFDSDPIPVRTAYNPEGTGETFDLESRLTTFGVSLDVLPLILDSPSAWDWTVGIARRTHELTLAEFHDDKNDWEAGTTLGWKHAVPDGRLTLAAGWSQRGLEETGYTYGQGEILLPRWRDLGLRVSMARDLNGQPGEEIEFTFLYGTRKDQVLDEAGFFGRRRYGFELAVLDRISIRAGRDHSNITADQWNYGLGLHLVDPWIERFELRYDFGLVEYSDSDEMSDQHAVQIHWRF